MTSQSQLLEQAIAQLQTQRELWDEPVREVMIHALRERLQSLMMSELPQKRKQVTILLATLSGFKLLTDTLEAEEVFGVMNTIWDELDNIIIEHGGRIDKHVGNTVMAIWGSGISRQTDPQEAVNSALALQKSMEALSQQWPIRLQIGIHTGSTLLGSISSTGEFIALGQSVKLVELLEEAAQAGQIIISYDTYRHVRGIFNVEKASPLLAAEGKGSVTQTYRVLSAKPRAFYVSMGEIGGVEPAFIGRRYELQQLQTILLALPTERRTTVVTVAGDAGIGKSRLLHEFHDWLELLKEITVWLFRARANEATYYTPYSLIYDLLADRFEIHSSDSVEVAREKWVAGMAAYWGDDHTAKAHVVGQLLGLNFSQSHHTKPFLSDSQALQSHAFTYLGEFFRAVQKHDGDDPIVLMLEDVHWADQGSLLALQHLITQCGGLPLLLVMAARPRFFEQLPNFPVHLSLELTPLDADTSQQLVESILQKGRDIPPHLTQLIIQQAEGNPFYLEEIIKMLLDERIITVVGEHWQMNMERWEASKLPSTLSGVLQNRFDSLSQDEQALLQQAAVIGRMFWDQAIFALNPKTTTEAIRITLEHLIQRDFVGKHKVSSLQGAEEYTFRHILLHDFIYHTILRPQKRRYHQQAAEWLIGVAGDRQGEYAERIAKHYEEAGEKRAASRYFFNAGQRAYQTNTYPQAIELYQRALSWLDPDDPQRAEVLNGLGLASIGLSLYPPARDYLQNGLKLPALASLTRASLLIGLGIVSLRQGEFGEAQRYLDEALTVAQTANDERTMANILRHQASLARLKGQYQQGVEYAQEALRRYESLQDSAGMLSSLISLGNVLGVQGKLVEAEQVFLRGFLLAQESGDRWGMSTLLGNLGEVARLGKNYKAAHQYYTDSLVIAQQIGHQQGVANAHLNHGLTALAEGDFAASLKSMQIALGVFMQIQGRAGQVACLLYRSELALAMDQAEKAAILLGAIQGNSALSSEGSQKWQELVADLRHHLSPTQMAQYLAQGTAELDALLKTMLDEAYPV